MAQAKPYYSLKAGNENFKLSLPINSIIEFEETWVHGDSISDFGEKINKAGAVDKDGERRYPDAPQPSMGEFRLLLWAALIEHHPDTSIRDAGEIMQKAGFAKVQEPLMNALNAAFPDEEDNAETNGSANGSSGANAGDPKEAVKEAG